MFECVHCDLAFEEKKLLTTHQKTKKCIVHRNILFMCQKCFKNIKGYANTVAHVSQCTENPKQSDVLTIFVKQLSSLNYNVSLHFENHEGDAGNITFAKIHTYTHPTTLHHSIPAPTKPVAFSKALTKYTDQQLLGSHNHYLNDALHKIYRLGDAFLFMSVKYDFHALMHALWFQTSYTCFHVKDDYIYVLAKIQSQNIQNKTWHGDTFHNKIDEHITKCIWYKDSDLKRFFINLRSLLKDILNLYLSFGNWCLKQDKIKLKSLKQEPDLKTKLKTISETMQKYGYGHLIDNVRKLNSYELFFPIFKELIDNNSQSPTVLLSNLKHVFKDDLLPLSSGESVCWPGGPASHCEAVEEEFSLMTMNDKELNINDHYLMYHILPDSEKHIFLSKI